MSFRISPLWWPAMAAFSPVIAPFLLVKNNRFKKNLKHVEELNASRMKDAKPFKIPEVDYLELTVLVDEKTEDGFLGDAGVSYLLKTNLGSILFDVGFGAERPSLEHNSQKIGFKLDQVDGVVISHLHPDHMGGIKAMRSNCVSIPESLGSNKNLPCFLPDKAEVGDMNSQVIQNPQLLKAGIASTGPLARSLFFFGLSEEQALFARVKGKGLVVITGCGHPTVEVIMKMVRQLSDEPLYAFCGGLHFPVSNGRGNRIGIQFQRLIGTGKPPWKKITKDDLSSVVSELNNQPTQQVHLSGHDSCDVAIDTLQKDLDAETSVLKTGGVYRF